ncbi:unnamed protein product [Rhodiola kirilowii]
MGSVTLVILAFCLALGSLSEGNHGKKTPSAVIVGSVQCEACLGHKASYFISGASVAVECSDGMRSKFKLWKEVKTKEKGKFAIRLPTAVVKNMKACSVKLIKSNQPECDVASTMSSTLVHQNTIKDKGSQHIFTAGLLTFKSRLCSQKRNFQADEQVTFMRNRIKKPVIVDEKLVPSSFFFPLPFNPFLPPVLPPNPLLPPPSIFPPVPGLTPPPSIFPPIPGLTPPPAPILPVPPIPGLTPPPPASIFPPFPGIPHLPGFASPPPPPPPSLLPPFPFPPGFPGIPPASSKSSAKP